MIIIIIDGFLIYLGLEKIQVVTSSCIGVHSDLTQTALIGYLVGTRPASVNMRLSSTWAGAVFHQLHCHLCDSCYQYLFFCLGQWYCHVKSNIVILTGLPSFTLLPIGKSQVCLKGSQETRVRAHHSSALTLPMSAHVWEAAGLTLQVFNWTHIKRWTVSSAHWTLSDFVTFFCGRWDTKLDLN